MGFAQVGVGARLVGVRAFLERGAFAGHDDREILELGIGRELVRRPRNRRYGGGSDRGKQVGMQFSDGGERGVAIGNRNDIQPETGQVLGDCLR